MDRYISRQITIQNGTFIIPFQQKKQFETAVVPMTDIDSSLDKDYQSLFKDKGFRKANQVLQHVNAEFQRYLSNSKLQDNNWSNLTILRSSTAIVSIGGADGSELKALMDALDSQHGILVEISPFAAAAARARGIDVVIEHDVIDAAHEVVLQLRKWQKQGRILTVLISCQSVLHELPSRSPTFTQEAFLQQYFTPLIKLGLKVMFYAREPCPPSNWSQLTDSIAIRLFKLDKDDVVMLSNYIAQKLKIPSKVNSTHISNDDTRVILPVVLAQEVLFKMLYWKDIAHFHYEMEEQLTSFQPQNWLASLKNIGMRGEIQYLTTEHFSDLYHKEEKFLGEAVAVNAHTGDRLEMPKCFVQLFASSEMSSRILMM
jgi:hypothetical protein